MKETEPCPLNGKDLVGECIVDELFDYGDYVHYPKEEIYLGLLDKVPTVVGYKFGSNVMFVEPRDYDAEKREKVFHAVETYAERFCEEEAHRKAGAKVGASQNFRFLAIKFFYYDE
jgi:hypothetical protein